MNIRLAQINPITGDLAGNKHLILDAIHQAEKDGVELLLLPGLAVCGTDLNDLIRYEEFREACYGANREIVQSTGNCAVLFGTLTGFDKKGAYCFDSVIAAEHGKELFHIRKEILLGGENITYAAAGDLVETIEIKGIRIGLLRKDVLRSMASYTDVYRQNLDALKKAQPLKNEVAFLLNITAAPFAGEPSSRHSDLIGEITEILEVPMIYVNPVGGNTSLIFEGNSQIVAADAKILRKAKSFAPDSINIEFNSSTLTFEESKQENTANTDTPLIAEKFHALVLGVSDYLRKSKAAKKALVGLSGGIDSALVCAIAAEALGADNVIGITMPSQFSSKGSISDSEKLAENLGISFMEIPIKPVYDAFLKQLAPAFEGTDFNVAEENLQSRTRGDLLMALANKYGYMVLDTGNKSELAVGYCTLYGDMVGGLAVIGDLYKTEVYEMCRWLNDVYYKTEMIPEHIIGKAPSAELRPNQKDTDSLPEYGVMDKILWYYLEEGFSRAQIIKQGIDEDIVDKVLVLTDINEYKRAQAAPVLKLSKAAFGVDRFWPVTQNWTAQRNKK